MKKFAALSLVVPSFVILTSLSFNTSVYAHSADESLGCQGYYDKRVKPPPDLTEFQWKKIEKIETDNFTYIFYRDRTRPDLDVAAMTVSVVTHVLRTNETVRLTRISWERNEKIFSVRNQISENVCERSVYGIDGKKYSLAGMMKVLRQRFKKAP